MGWSGTRSTSSKANAPSMRTVVAFLGRRVSNAMGGRAFPLPGRVVQSESTDPWQTSGKPTTSRHRHSPSIRIRVLLTLRRPTFSWHRKVPKRRSSRPNALLRSIPVSWSRTSLFCDANNSLGRPDRALEFADKAIRLSPRDPYFWISIPPQGVAIFMKGDYAIAPLNFTQLLLSSSLALTRRSLKRTKR
jgi:hypothetical protein